jgi:RHS repeat-associated protein
VEVDELPDLESARRQAAAQGSRVEVSASGTASSETFVNPDGSLTTVAYAAPSFRRSGVDRRGTGWVPLSAAISGAGTAADPWTLPGLAWPVALGRSADALVSVALPGGMVSIGAVGLQVGRPVRDGQTITYAGVAADTDLQLVATPAGVKTNLVLRSAAAPRSFRFHVADPAGALGAGAEQRDGSWRFSADLGDGYRLALAPATAYVPAEVAAAGLGSAGVDRSSASQSVVRAGDGWDVTVAVNADWLAGRAFPVVLDPSPTFVSGSAGFPDCHLNSGPFADTSFCSAATRDVGFGAGYVRRTILAFQTTSIPTTAQVSDADLDLNLDARSGGSSTPVKADRLTGGWSTAATWNSNGAVPWSGGNADFSVVLAETEVGDTLGHYHWALSTPVVQDWVKHTLGNYGVLLRLPDESVATIARFDSGFAADPATRPRLTVTYTDPAALQVDRTDSYSPVLSGLVTGGPSVTYSTTFTVTPPAGLGAAFTSPASSLQAGERASYTIPRDKKLVAGKTYTWTMKQCNGATCTTSAVQSFTVDPLIVAGDRSFFRYRDWQLTDRLRLRVNAASGNLLAEMTDLSVPGVTGDTRLGRTYNSLALAPGSQNTAGSAGPGWTASVGADVRVALRRDGSATVYTSSGYAALFVPNSSGGFTGPPGSNATLSRPDGKWRYTEHKSAVRWDFDAAGRLTTVKDRSGNATTIRRDGSGNVSAVDGSRGGPDPTAGTSARRVKVNDGISPSTGALRNYRQFPNTGSGLADRTVTFGYTGSDLTSVTDAGGKTTTFGYDGSHRLTSITTAADADTVARTTTIGYESGGYRVTSVRQETSTGVGPTTTFAYDDTNKKTTVTPPKVNATGDTQRDLVYEWDNEHRVTKVVNGFGKAISTTTWTGNSQVATTATAANVAAGVATVNTYAANGENLTQSVSAASATTDFAGYGTAGSATEFLPGSSTNAANSTSTYRYDGTGNLTSNTGGAANEAIVERNTNGTVKFTTDPENIDDGTTKPAPACRRTLGATSYVDNCTSYSYDAWGNLTGIVPPDDAGSLGNRAYTYDGFGRLKTVNNGRGFITTYGYDPMDRTTTVTTSKAGDAAVSYTFDAVGNQISRIDATGTTTYRYDKLNRLIVKDLAGTAADCSAGPTATRLCYGWDDASNMVSLGDGRGTTTYHYSPIGLLDEVNEHTGRTIVMAYDDDQRRVETWYATNIAANGTTYNSTTHQLVVPTSWAMRTKVTLDADGRLTRTQTWRGGVADNTHRVADLSYSYTQPASLPAACTGSTLGRGAGTDAGRRTSRTDNIAAETQTYCYDGAGRLRVRTGTGSVTVTYTYDKNGNRTTDTWGSDPTTTYTYNAGNQLTSGGHTYDPAGNQTDGAALTAATYNGYDQATSVTPTGGTATALTAAGTTNTELVTQGSTTLRNGLPGVQALTTGGNTAYVQRDPNGGLLALVTGSGTTGEYYYVLDGQSSVIGLVDAAGTERARYTYDPYGAHDTAVAVNGTLPDNPYRYASGRAIATNASNQVVLYQYGQRFYQRSTGRWTQQDNLEHLGDPAQGNRYAYVGGDPINQVDPTGQSWGSFFAFTGAAFAIAGLAAASPVAAGVLGGLAVASDVAGAAASGATGTEIAAVAVFGVATWGIGGAGALVGASRTSQAVVGGIYTAGGFGANYVFTN